MTETEGSSLTPENVRQTRIELVAHSVNSIEEVEQANKFGVSWIETDVQLLRTGLKEELRSRHAGYPALGFGYDRTRDVIAATDRAVGVVLDIKSIRHGRMEREIGILLGELKKEERKRIALTGGIHFKTRAIFRNLSSRKDNGESEILRNLQDAHPDVDVWWPARNLQHVEYLLSQNNVNALSIHWQLFYDGRVQALLKNWKGRKYIWGALEKQVPTLKERGATGAMIDYYRRV